MKICIVSSGETLNSLASSRFGRAPYLLILNEKGEIEEVLSNEGVQAIRGAGIAAAQEVASTGVNILISGNIGPKALEVLVVAGVKIFFASPNLTVEKAFLMWKENKLTQIDKSSGPSGFGQGNNQGRGFGQGGQGLGRGRNRR